MTGLYMVFDVESVGLHGEGFAVGWVVIEGEKEVGSGYHATDPINVGGNWPGRQWVAKNVVGLRYDCDGPLDVRHRFWAAWSAIKARGGLLVADCLWPVEARFLIQCVDDDPDAREWGGPYPFIDVASVRLAAGLDPLATADRLPDELPAHDPLADARQSARLFIEALKVTGGAR